MNEIYWKSVIETQNSSFCNGTGLRVLRSSAHKEILTSREQQMSSKLNLAIPSAQGMSRTVHRVMDYDQGNLNPLPFDGAELPEESQGIAIPTHGENREVQHATETSDPHQDDEDADYESSTPSSPASAIHHTSSSESLTGKKYPRTGKRGAPQAFAHKLYEILQEADEAVITWSKDGTSFMILDIDSFVSTTLLKHFRHRKFSSFQRQLNLYGFRKAIKGADAGAYYHEYFRRGRPDLLVQVRRAPQRQSSPDAAPSSNKAPSRKQQPVSQSRSAQSKHEENRHEPSSGDSFPFACAVQPMSNNGFYMPTPFDHAGCFPMLAMPVGYPFPQHPSTAAPYMAPMASLHPAAAASLGPLQGYQLPFGHPMAVPAMQFPPQNQSFFLPQYPQDMRNTPFQTESQSRAPKRPRTDSNGSNGKSS